MAKMPVIETVVRFEDKKYTQGNVSFFDWRHVYDLQDVIAEVRNI